MNERTGIGSEVESLGRSGHRIRRFWQELVAAAASKVVDLTGTNCLLTALAALADQVVQSVLGSRWLTELNQAKSRGMYDGALSSGALAAHQNACQPAAASKKNPSICLQILAREDAR